MRFYDVLTVTALSLLFAKEGVSRLIGKGKKRSLFAKLRVPPLPKPEPVLRIWLHAVSVGEVRAAGPLIERLFADYPDVQLFLSTATLGGLATAKKEFPNAAAHFLLPFDFSFHAKSLFTKIAPHALLFCEGDLWPSLLKEASSQNIPTILINGKLSPSSSRLFSLVPFFSRPFFDSLDLICMQSEEHRERMEPFVSSEKLHVTGNVKFDRANPLLDGKELSLWRERLSLRPEEKILTIGSTHPGEEELLLRSLRTQILPLFRILLVPRHPERGAALLTSLTNLGFSCSLLSQGARADSSVVIVDAMGVLCDCYQLSDFAIVAGSFVPGLGGHNLIEPIAYGAVPIFGPYVDTQFEMKELLLGSQAGLMLPAEQLEEQLLSLLADRGKLTEMQERGAKAVASLEGATEATYKLLLPFLKGVAPK